MQWIGYLCFRLVTFIFHLIPFKVLYALSDVLALFLRIGGYRKSVIWKNLTYAFPEKSDVELKKLLPGIYKNFTDILLESVKGILTPGDVLDKRHQFIRTPEYDEILKNGKSQIVFAAHYANWEWATATLAKQSGIYVIGFYKPLKNKLIDQLIIDTRRKTGTGLVSVYGGRVQLEKGLEQQTSVIYICDQRPSNQQKGHLVHFFGKEVKALQGAGEFAHSKNLPTWFYKIIRTGRGKYEVHPILLHLNPSELSSPRELTQMFYDHLEAQIKDQPEHWLWTHKRWKDEIKY